MLRILGEVLTAMFVVCFAGAAFAEPVAPSKTYDAKAGITKVMSQRMYLRLVKDPEQRVTDDDEARFEIAFSGWWLGRTCCEANAERIFSVNIFAVSELDRIFDTATLRPIIAGQTIRVLDQKIEKKHDRGKNIEIITAGIRDSDLRRVADAKLTSFQVGGLELELDRRENERLLSFLKAFGVGKKR